MIPNTFVLFTPLLVERNETLRRVLRIVVVKIKPKSYKARESASVYLGPQAVVRMVSVSLSPIDFRVLVSALFGCRGIAGKGEENKMRALMFSYCCFVFS